jgi:hypothetical protein
MRILLVGKEEKKNFDVCMWDFSGNSEVQYYVWKERRYIIGKIN